MSWQDGMNEALIGYVISRGALVTESASQRSPGQRIYGGWQEYAWDDATQDETPALTIHMRHCTADLARSSWQDSDWEDFNGTFAEPPWEQRSGTDAVVYCICGQVQGRRWRYTGGLAELIRAITAPPEQPGPGRHHAPQRAIGQGPAG
jgi:hypothetical protein